MLGTRCFPVLFAALILLGSAPAVVAQQSAPIVGEWKIMDGDAAGQKVEFRADGTGSVVGTEVTWQIVREGVVRCSAGPESMDFEYQLANGQLTLSVNGNSVTCSRVGGAPTPPPTPAPVNPLGPPVAAAGPDFARKFTGDDITLHLSGSAEAGYKGELKYGTSLFPVSARSEGKRLTGEFTSGDQQFPFTGTLDGDRLEFTTGGKTFVLVGKPSAPQNPTNPLAGGNPPAPANPLSPGGGDQPSPTPSPATPDPLGGVYTGKAGRYEHPKGYFSFDMPEGWSVFKDGPDGLLLNPGLKETDSLDALIIVGHGELDPAQQNRPINEVVDAAEADLVAGLRQQGIEVQPAGKKAHAVLVGDVPGAIQSWKGKSGSGQDITVWFGGVTKREFYLSVLAIIVSGKEDTFLPKVKRIFNTLAPKPPQRNIAVERALAGCAFFHTSSSSGGSFSVIYTFGQENSVSSESLISPGLPGGMDVGSQGHYEVIGDVVYLYFKDGQHTATVLVENGSISGLKFGESVYSLR